MVRKTLLRWEDNPTLWNQSVDRFLHKLYNLGNGEKVPFNRQTFVMEIFEYELSYLDMQSIMAIYEHCKKVGLIEVSS